MIAEHCVQDVSRVSAAEKKDVGQLFRTRLVREQRHRRGVANGIEEESGKTMKWTQHRVDSGMLVEVSDSVVIGKIFEEFVEGCRRVVL